MAKTAWVQDLGAASVVWDACMSAAGRKERNRAFVEVMYLCMQNPKATAQEIWRMVRLRKEGKG